MSRIRSLFCVFVLTSVICGTTAAQTLAKRHQIELRIGGWSQVTDSRTEVGPTGVTTTVGSNGFIGGIAYGHWLNEELAFRISAGVLAANIDVQSGITGVDTDFAAVLPLLFGMRYYFPRSTRGQQFRPFVGAGAGTVLGRQATVQAGVTVLTEARAETAFGGQAEAGVCFLLGQSVMATVALAYDLFTDFEQPIGGSSNYSGPQMTMGLSFLLGRGTSTR